jgi:hypothetical protein
MCKKLYDSFGIHSECILPTVEIHINEFCDNVEIEVVYKNTRYVVWSGTPLPPKFFSGLNKIACTIFHMQ